ncbi:MAG: OmpA family protein [Sphingomonadales bacterium]|jgi:outer membrane protein OmpA-like peptidoglycan-associated protein
MKNSPHLIGAVLIAAFGLSACTTDPYTGERKLSRTAIGAGVGAAVGAGAGAIGGGRKATLIGLGVGTLAGAAVGGYMDAQEAKLRRQLQSTGVSVTRDGDSIILNMPSNVTFDVNQSSVRAEFSEVLNSVALVLNEYKKTYVDVLGHTDSTGSEQYNLNLSVQRAQSVANYLMGRGVIQERFVIRGLGESLPIASNATEAGRAQNRRVEIVLQPLT